MSDESETTAIERARELVNYIAKDDGALKARMMAFLPGQEFASLVLGVLGRQSELFRASSEEDIEGVFRLILKLLPLMTPSEHDAVIDAMAAAVTSTAADKPLVRLKM